MESTEALKGRGSDAPRWSRSVAEALVAAALANAGGGRERDDDRAEGLCQVEVRAGWRWLSELVRGFVL